MNRLALILLASYIITSVAAFIAYATDKHSAILNQQRTPELALHLIALIGGWPGALLAQTLLRHKTRKQPFQLIFRATVVLNCAVVSGLSIGMHMR